MKDLKVIKIKTQKPYNVYVKDGAINDVAPYVKNHLIGKNVLVITDDVVSGLYLETIINSLNGMGKTAYSFTIKNGEESKNFDNFKAIIDFLAENEFTRKDTIIALGGGVVGDLSGFVASTYLRGVALVQIPTTLLSAVDSSVGGKTGIDTKKGKNLVGTFYSPKAVVIDTNIIKNLPSAVFNQGYGEVIKYAVLDKKIYNEISKPNCDLEKVIAKCVAYKNKIVSKDEFEGYQRKFLNLGHTYAHAVEKISGYSVSHGIAVIMGVKKIAQYAYKSGLLNKQDHDKILSLISKTSVPDTCFGVSEVVSVIKSDKKRQGDYIDLVVPVKIGKVKIIKTHISKLGSVYAIDNDK